ncbi:MAG: hypothetical protein ACREOH_19285, partial [Candidatus Entotheonellia bacterium]
QDIVRQNTHPPRTIRQSSHTSHFLSLLRLLDFFPYLTFLVRFGIVTKLTRNGHVHPLWVFKIPVIAFPPTVDKARAVKVSDQLSDFTRHFPRYSYQKEVEETNKTLLGTNTTNIAMKAADGRPSTAWQCFSRVAPRWPERTTHTMPVSSVV